MIVFRNRCHTHLMLLMIAAMLFMLGGCSGTADYSKTVNELKSAIDSSIATVRAIDKEVTKKQNADWRAAVMANRAILQNKDGNCSSGTEGCRLQVRLAGEKPVDFPVASVLIESQKGLSALKSYVANLKAIVDADSAGQITAHTTSALVSLAKIETEIAKHSGQDPKKSLIAAYREPAGALFGWAIGQYVERIKFDALSTATKRAHPAISRLDNLMTTIGKTAAKLEFAKAQKAFVTEKSKYETAEDTDRITEKSIHDYIDAAAIYDQALRASAAEPLAAFTRAHEKLTMHLNGENDISLADAMAAIEDLKERAEAFKVLIDGFKTAGS